MKTKQYITRKGSIDCGHRVMYHAFACNNYHGHTYLYELEFEFNSTEEIGYAIDFKEIKRIGVAWLLDKLDHSFIANPKDSDIIGLVKQNNMKLWEMSLAGEGEFCNPTVENIAKEIFLAMELLFSKFEDLKINKVVLYETPNNFTVCTADSISHDERVNFRKVRQQSIEDYALQKCVYQYDIRVFNSSNDPNSCGV